MIKDTSLSSYAFGWFSMIFGSLTLNDLAVLIGMFATIFGFIVTWIYQHLNYKLNKNQLIQQTNKKRTER